MKNLLLISLCAILMSFTSWEANFETAKKNAKEEHKLILLNFSGSDWCGPCIRMHKEIFGDATFLKMAGENLAMFNADFPRNKKNQLSKDLKKQNEWLADAYNPTGKFPYTVLLNADGKVLKAWEGLPDQTVAAFTAEIKQICDANK
ncbi:thioredoxin family protein [Pedobacter sp. ASV28]|uniref:thioredoxin family protein n=1 Tax=Pedobacter sp. ASV28 TaxID=2795123 RepID=UPI0018EB1462|nr:thioredoxin family protein [Pedobacter sp. ASV28]